jgi:hypothetical protein
MIEDGGQIAVAEPACDRGQAQRLVDTVSADNGGELDRAGHLRPDPLRSGGGGLGQPPGRARTEVQECFLSRRPGARPGLARSVAWWVMRVMLAGDPRAARRGQGVAGNLGQPAAGAGDDDQLAAVHPAPDPVPDMTGRGGVPHRPEPDRLILVHQPFLAQRQHIRLARQRMQMLALGGQPLDGDCGAFPVHPAVDPLAPRRARVLQLAEAGILGGQVHQCRHQVRFGDLHRRLGAAFGLGIERPACLHGGAVVPAQRDHVRVADRDPGDMLDGHGPGVIGEQIGRDAADDLQCTVQARGQAPERLVPRRQHHPEPGPGQPAAEQLRPAAADLRALAPVPLQPHPRLGDPRPVSPPVPGPPHGLGLGDHPPGAALRARISHRGQPAVHHISADLPAAAIHQLLNLAGELIRRPRPARGRSRVMTSLPQRHVSQDGLAVGTGQLRRRVRAAGQVIRLQNFHDLPARLSHGSLRAGGCEADTSNPPTPEGSLASGHAGHREIR